MTDEEIAKTYDRAEQLLLAFIGSRAIIIPPKPGPATPTIPPWIAPIRPQRWAVFFALAQPKFCRICSAPIPPGQRFCGARCRLEASGKPDLVLKADAQHGWQHVELSTTRRT